jgi:ribonuclease HI
MDTRTMQEVIIYSDGACKGNPGPGGWGVLVKEGGAESRELFGGELDTTNNRMELMAAIKGLESIVQASRIVIYTDSKYVIQGITDWIKNWKTKGWKTASKQPVKNIDLWQSLDRLIQFHTVTWHWIKGHSGDPGNERADALANRGVASMNYN